MQDIKAFVNISVWGSKKCKETYPCAATADGRYGMT